MSAALEAAPSSPRRASGARSPDGSPRATDEQGAATSAAGATSATSATSAKRPRQWPWKTALVTGAGSGIGAAIAASLARGGVKVLVTDRDLESATRHADALNAERSAGALAAPLALDVTDPEAFVAALAHAESLWGPLDLLVNNAGVGLAGEVRDLQRAHWNPVLRVNVDGVVNGVQAAYPAMAERGRGWILNVASGAGLLPRPGMVPYAAAKHAVVGLSTSLAAEASGLGVVVTCACPGYVRTEIQSSSPFVGVDPKRALEKIPISPLSADACAERALRGLQRRRVIVYPNRLTWLEHFLYRLSPALGSQIARWRGAQLRAART